jgi:hypothetical protein
MGLEDVPGDLIAEVREGRESFLIPKLLEKNELDLLVVQIAREVEQVGFDAELWLRAFQSWTRTDVDDCAMEATRKLNLGSIDPGRWQHQAGDLEVGGGKPELSAKLISWDNVPEYGIRPTKHLAGNVKIAPGDSLANASAADRFAVQSDGRKSVDREAEFCTELAQQLHVTATFVPEGEIRADANAPERAGSERKGANEFFPASLTELLVEVNEQGDLHAERLEDSKLLSQRIDERWRTVRRDDGVGVAVKGDDQSDCFVLPSDGSGLTNDLLMAQVNAIEETDRQAHSALVRAEFAWGVDDSHCVGKILFMLKRLNYCERTVFKRVPDALAILDQSSAHRPRVLAAGQRQERDDQLLELRFSHLQHRLKFGGVRDIEFTRFDTPQVGQVRATGDLLA